MPNFRNAPKARPSLLIAVDPGDLPRTWDVETEDGDHFVLQDVDLRRLGHPLQRADNGAGLYALVSETKPAMAYAIDHRERTVALEDGTTMPIEDFLRTMVRVKSDGCTICAFIEPFHVQQQACLEAGAEGMVHRYDLQASIDFAREGGFREDVGMFDIVVSGLADETPFLQRMQNAMSPSWTPAALDTMSRMAIPPHAWREIKDHPNYNLDQVRAMFRNLMEPYIGAFPIERVKMVVAPPGAVDLAVLIGEGIPHVATREPFRAANIMIGYETSAVEHFEGDDVEAIVFSDPSGSYAYAWPRQPKPDVDPAPGGPAP